MAQKFPPAALYSKNTEVPFQSLSTYIFFLQILLCAPSMKNFILCGKDGELIE